MPTATSHRRRLTAEARREQILDAVKAIVGAEGFHGVTIERVARDAGITRPVVYQHFGDLEGLLSALVEREGRRALEQVVALLPTDAAAPESGTRSHLISMLGGYLEAVRRDPVTWRLVLMPEEGVPAMLAETVKAGRGAIVASLAELVVPAIGGGGAVPDPELMARTMSALSDESARLVLEDPDRYPVDRLLAHADWLLTRLGG